MNYNKPITLCMLWLYISINRITVWVTFYNFRAENYQL